MTPTFPEVVAEADALPVTVVAEAAACLRRAWYRLVEGYAPPPVAPPETSGLAGAILSSDAWHLTSVADDVAEEQAVGGVLRRYPVVRTDTPDVVAQVRLFAEGLLLEEALGQSVSHGYIEAPGTGARQLVPFTEALRAQFEEAHAAVLAMRDADRIPPPVADERCPPCPLLEVCLPFEVQALLHPEAPPPRVVPRDTLARTLYVDAPGSMVRLQAGQLMVEQRDEAGTRQTLARLPAVSVERVLLVGHVQVSTQALHTLLAQGVEVMLMTAGGRLKGRLSPVWHPNAHLRLHQYGYHQQGSLSMARAFVAGKIENYRVLLLRYARRGADALLAGAARQLQALRRPLAEAPDLATLMGLEGHGSRVWFGQFGRLIRASGFEFTHRSRRPPRDPVNALLSFAYALLLGDVLSACQVAGLDPYIGFLHRPRYGRPALALDLMEEFRPVVADSVVLTLLNTGMIQPGHFEEKLGGVYLNEAGRKTFYRAWNDRRREEVLHPVFGYRLPYHRIIEVQARLLAQVLTSGGTTIYRPFAIR
jgi:CRISPR-associated protein Cas1